MSQPKPSVLIVEDDSIIVFMLQMCFEQFDFDIAESVDTAKDAVDFAEKTPQLTLISMDITLNGEGNGVDAAREIRARGINTPILFASANTDFEPSTRDIPNSLFLGKPIDYFHLKESVERLTGFEIDIDM